MAGDLKQKNMRLADEDIARIDKYAEESGAKVWEVVHSALDAYEAKSWAASNPAWASASADVKSHLDAVGRAFDQLAEAEAELDRAAREKSAEQLANAQSLIDRLEATLAATEAERDRLRSDCAALEAERNELRGKLVAAEEEAAARGSLSELVASLAAKL